MSVRLLAIDFHNITQTFVYDRVKINAMQIKCALYYYIKVDYNY